MNLQTVIPGIYQLSLGFVNVFLIDQGELTLIDTGVPGSAPAILDALRALGKQPADLRHILLTHLHTDHTGSAQVLKEATGARVHMHPLDADSFQKGITMRPAQSGPGFINRVVGGLLRGTGPASSQAAEVDVPLEDGQTLDFAGDLRVIVAPGHTAGHTVFLSPAAGGVLICGDAASHMFRLGYSMIYEDLVEGTRSLRKLSALEFNTACFSHGKTIPAGASRAFRTMWLKD